MEHGARLSTSRVMAIAFIFMSVLIVLSLSVNVIQGVNNYRLQNEQRTAVTPMAFNAPFAVSQNSADASYLQQMALSFIALRLNVSSETVDASHQALLQYIRPGAQNQMKVILAEEAKRIKTDNVNSAFFQTSVRVWPQYGRVEIRGVLKTWIGDSKPFTDIKHGTVAKLAMRQPFVLFKGLTFQKLCLPGAFRPGDHHNKMLRPGLCVVHASPQYL
ncbi:type IV conjugative transfer system protein TraE [Escherichia coli]|nr:type IV conjugative transfer system protein TraE [Escherichia coli]